MQTHELPDARAALEEAIRGDIYLRLEEFKTRTGLSVSSINVFFVDICPMDSKPSRLLTNVSVDVLV